MEVVFFPYDGTHPYQKELAEKLAALGVSVRPGLKSSFFPVLRSLARSRMDVAHVHWANSYLLGRNCAVSLVKSILFIFELACCRLSGIRIVWTIHNICNHENYQYRLEMFFNKLIARLADAIIVHGPSHKEEVRAAYGMEDGAKISVIKQGNYASFYANDVSRADARARLGLGAEEKVLLFFGNIRRYKGALELAAEFGKVRDAGARLLIAGKPFDGGIRSELEAAAGRDARIKIFQGFVPDAEVQVYMNACDAVVLPYTAITTSAALLLAMSFGKAVIAPALGYISDIAGSSGSILYRPEDPEGLYSALRQALTADLPGMGLRNLALARAYTWNDAARGTLDIYKALVK